MAPKEKRRQILLAAEKLFTSRRFHEITLDEVAQRAGVGKGTIYQHFHDKDDLFMQVVTSGLDELADLLRRRGGEDGTFTDQLLNACVEITTFFDRRHQLFRMMQVEDARLDAARGEVKEHWMAKRHEVRQALAEIIQRGAATGQVRCDVPPDTLASFLMGMLRARAHDLREAPEELRRLELLINLFCHGVCCPAPTAEAPRPA